MPITIFFCYAREDEALLNMLKSHLRQLQREGLIAVWHDRDIRAGDEWEHEIDEHLNAAQIILLLVSPDFMNSDYCYGTEMKRALERHERGEAKVIPVILRPVYWHGKPLGKLQALPTDGKPVTSSYWHDVDSALYDVTNGVYKVVEEWAADRASETKDVAEATPPKVAQVSSNPSIVQSTRNVAPVIAPLAVEKLRLLHTLTGHTGPVYSVAISGDGKTLVSGSEDKTIKMWDLSTGKEVRTLSGHKDYVFSIAISGDRKTAVSGSRDNMIKVWDLSTGKEVRTLSKHNRNFGCVAISADGKTLASGSWEKTIEVWDLSTGQEVWTLAGHTGAVQSVAISADRETLVSGSEDKTIKVWKLSTGIKMRTLTGHTGGVLGLAISEDGETLVNGGGVAIKIWQLSTGKELRTLTGHTDNVWSVAISADGHTLVSGSEDGTIKVWGV